MAAAGGGRRALVVAIVAVLSYLAARHRSTVYCCMSRDVTQNIVRSALFRCAGLFYN